MACRTIPSRKNRHLGLGFPPKCRDPWTEVAPSPPALPAASSSLTPDRGIWMPHCQTLTGQMPGRRAWSAMPDCLEMSFLGVRLVTLHLKLTLSALPDKLSLGYPPGSTINPGPGSPIISFMSPNLWQNYWRLLVVFRLMLVPYCRPSRALSPKWVAVVEHLGSLGGSLNFDGVPLVYPIYKSQVFHIPSCCWIQCGEPVSHMDEPVWANCS